MSMRMTSAGLSFSGRRLQQVGLAVVHLDRVGPGVDQRVDDAGHVLQPDQEARLVADAVVDGDVEAAAVGEQPVHPGLGAHAHVDTPVASVVGEHLARDAVIVGELAR